MIDPISNILQYSILFSPMTSPNCSKSDDYNNPYNNLFIKSVNRYINEVLREYGYISWEKINRCLGIEPNPDDIDRIKTYRYNGYFLELIPERLFDDNYPSYMIHFKEVTYAP